MCKEAKQTEHGTGSDDHAAVVALKVIRIDVGFRARLEDGQGLEAVEPRVGEDLNHGPHGVDDHEQGCEVHPRTVFKHKAGQAGGSGGSFIGHGETSLA